MKNPHKIISVVLLTGVIMIALCLYRCPIQPNTAMGQSTKIMDFYVEFVGRGALTLLREYSVECYADSTKVRMGLFYTFEGAKFKAAYNPRPFEKIGNLIEVKDEWIHCEPTLPGFIAWLEEKYEVQK